MSYIQMLSPKKCFTEYPYAFLSKRVSCFISIDVYLEKEILLIPFLINRLILKKNAFNVNALCAFTQRNSLRLGHSEIGNKRTIAQ